MYINYFVNKLSCLILPENVDLYLFSMLIYYTLLYLII